MCDTLCVCQCVSVRWPQVVPPTLWRCDTVTLWNCDTVTGQKRWWRIKDGRALSSLPGGHTATSSLIISFTLGAGPQCVSTHFPFYVKSIQVKKVSFKGFAFVAGCTLHWSTTSQSLVFVADSHKLSGLASLLYIHHTWSPIVVLSAIIIGNIFILDLCLKSYQTFNRSHNIKGLAVRFVRLERHRLLEWKP